MAAASFNCLGGTTEIVDAARGPRDHFSCEKMTDGAARASPEAGHLLII
jgi:hypothetical protein